MKATRPDVTWICSSCAIKLGAESYPNHMATFHLDNCGICDKTTQVTEPRDYKWNFKIERHFKNDSNSSKS